MHVKREQINATKVKLVITADQAIIDQVKAATVKQMSQNVKVPGFRPGKAPANLIEKQLDQSVLQTEFLEQAVNHLYVEAAQHEKLRPVSQPEITISKFVPYTDLEFTSTVETVGQIALPDYTKIKLESKPTAVTAKDVTQVIDNLLSRGASKQVVKRVAKDGDEVIIDFKGSDAKTHESIAGADGKEYPLVIGSKTFIPGFEDHLLGAKAEKEVEFDLIFPADYGVKNLQKRKVHFVVNVRAVQEVSKPKLDDAFAASIGPFKTVAELKADVKKQLSAEAVKEQQRTYDNQLLETIANKSTVAIPESLIEEEIDRIEDEEKRNIAYRGQTWQEHLDEEAVTAEAHRERQRGTAEIRVKAGLVLAQIAEQENILVSPDELEVRIQLLKGQYSDDNMQAELDNPDNRRDIMNRLLSEKTLDKLRSYASK